MADTVNVGTAPNNNSGDLLRTAFQLVNARFELDKSQSLAGDAAEAATRAARDLEIEGQVASIAASFTFRGNWTTATVYNAGTIGSLTDRREIVKGPVGGAYENTAYVVMVDHTSGTFLDDLAVGKLLNTDAVQLAADLLSTGTTKGAHLVAGVDVQLADYTALRSYAGGKTRVYVTGALATAAPQGISGVFVHRSTDAASADNGGTIIVDGTGRRWHRETQGERITPAMFGCDATGAANCTAQLKKFYEACIAGVAGHIGAGVYLIDRGQLSFSNGGSDKAFPSITTDGYKSVMFRAANDADSPLLSFDNGVMTTDFGRFWMGGEHGGVLFDQSTRATKTGNQHGLQLHGVKGTQFGFMSGYQLGGATVAHPYKVVGGINPDPYSLTFVSFYGIEGIQCNWSFYNGNQIGFNASRIGNIYCISNRVGGWHGIGLGNVVDGFSASDCFGWAIDDGSIADPASTGGKLTLGWGEIDNCQYGLRLQKGTKFDYAALRIVYRKQFSANTLAIWWPIAGIDLAPSAGASLDGIKMNTIHRIDSYGSPSAVGFGNMIKTNNAQIAGVDIDALVQNNAGITITDAMFVDNVNANSEIVITKNGKKFADTRAGIMFKARGDGTTQINDAGFGAAGVINFPVEVFDKYGCYTSPAFVAPYTGLFFFHVRFALTTPAANTLVRFGFSQIQGGSYFEQGIVSDYSNTTGRKHYETTASIYLQKGDSVAPVGAVAGGPIACTPGFSHLENVFEAWEGGR